MIRNKSNIKRTIAKRFDLHNKQINNAIKNNRVIKTNEDKKKEMGVKIVGEYGMLKVQEIKKETIQSVKKEGEYGTVNVTYSNDQNLEFFDVIIIISSYNRLLKIKRILNQLYSQETKYKFKLIILDDGSTENYDELLLKYRDFVLLKNESNYGKFLYWKSITKLFAEASKYKANAILQIDDDFILCDNFLNELMDLFYEKRGGYDNVACIAYHLMDCSLSERWGVSYNWVDGGGLYDYEFIKSIGFKVGEVNKNRWKNDKNLSSGVWQQISNLLTSNKKSIYKPIKTYAVHDGNEDSKMNTELRTEIPIKTKLDE